MTVAQLFGCFCLCLTLLAGIGFYLCRPEERVNDCGFTVGQKVSLKRSVQALAECAWPFFKSGTLEENEGMISLERGTLVTICGFDIDGLHALVRLRPDGEVLRVSACFLEEVRA